ncbi:MFS transporter [Streptomyces sp. NPDC058320]|uniref:MFS transporter n=1 Tax=unclassified Streptomyces TaxID=2593676 RepID=UPI00362658AE
MSANNPSAAAEVSTRPVSATSASPRRAWLIAVLLFLFVIVNFAAKAVLGLAAKPLSAELGLSSTQYGVISSVFFLVFCLASVAGGVLADRMPSRWLLLGMAVVWALSQIPIVAGAGFSVILASRAVLGAAEGPASPVAVHLLYKWFPPESRNLPSALLIAAAPLGVVLAAPLLGSLITHHGWRSAFVAVSVAGALWSVAWFFLGHDGEEHDGEETATAAAVHDRQQQVPAAQEAPGVGYGAVMRTGTFLSNLVASFAAYWAMALLLAFVPAYLEDVLGYDTAEASRTVALPWTLAAAAVLLSPVLIPWLLRRGVSDRTANNGVSVTAAALAGLALLGLAQGPAGWFRILCLALGFSLAAVVFPIALTSLGRLTPARLRGGTLGIYAALYSFGAVVAPLVTGKLLDSRGHTAAAYNTAFVISAVLALVGAAAVALFNNPERDRNRILGSSATP